MSIHSQITTLKRAVKQTKAPGVVPVRKGDIVVLLTKHSSTELHGPTKTYERYALARVVKTDRVGRAVDVALRPTGPSEWLKRSGRRAQAFAITPDDLQAKARRVFERLTDAEAREGYPTRESIKAAILATEG